MISKYFLKSLLKNKNIWGWGILFMLFWIFMGAFVFGTNFPDQKIYFVYNASIWFGLLGLVSTSTMATSVAYSIYYGNSSLAYGFRFTTLKPSGYITSFAISTSIIGGMLSAFMLLFTFLLFSYKSGFMLIPAFPYISIIIGFASGAFMFLLASIIIVIVNNYLGLRNVSFATFIPMILTYLFGFAQINAGLPSYVVYGSPFTDISDLFIWSYYGKEIPHNLSGSLQNGGQISLTVQVIMLILWIIILSILSFMLIKRIKPKSIEEGRQV